MNVQRLFRKAATCIDIFSTTGRASYSQVGEDLIVDYLLHSAGIKTPSYLDVGTNHPKIGNNTYYFYTRGSRGVCVEPDPALFKEILKHRPADKNLNIGIGLEGNSKGRLHVFPEPYTGWNTFSEDEARAREAETGIKSKQVIEIGLRTINDIIAENFAGGLNFLSLDVEGLDEQILKTLDFDKHRPDVICVETISFSQNNNYTKNTRVSEYLSMNGYFEYADTFVNTIFCRTDLINLQR